MNRSPTPSLSGAGAVTGAEPTLPHPGPHQQPPGGPPITSGGTGQRGAGTPGTRPSGTGVPVLWARTQGSGGGRKGVGHTPGIPGVSQDVGGWDRGSQGAPHGPTQVPAGHGSPVSCSRRPLLYGRLCSHPEGEGVRPRDVREGWDLNRTWSPPVCRTLGPRRTLHGLVAGAERCPPFQ